MSMQAEKEDVEKEGSSGQRNQTREAKNKKRPKELIEVFGSISSAIEGKVKVRDSPQVKLAKKIGKELFGDEIEAKLGRLDSMDPMTELDQYQMTRWLKDAQEKMEESALKTYLRGYKGKMPSYYVELERENERKRRTEVARMEKKALKRECWKQEEQGKS